jgi:glycosyltransferase involved in cell wall biosynthesis
MATVSPRPPFSVIMPAYNAGGTVESSIRSVLRQSRQDFELIVVDDGSTDDTGRKVEAFGDGRIRLLRRPNGGPAAARNEGIAEARGDYVSMLDSDDMWMPRYLEAMAAALAAAPRAGLAFTDAWVFDDTSRRIRTSTAMAYWRPSNALPENQKSLLLLLLERNFIFTSATVRRSVIDAVGGYDERLWYAEDYELWVRIVAAGNYAVATNEVLAIHRDRRGSLTSDTGGLYRGICRVYDVIREEHDLDEDARAVVNRSQRYWQQQLMALEAPSRRQRVRHVARSLKQRARERSLWLEQPPSPVADTLEACRAVLST